MGDSSLDLQSRNLPFYMGVLFFIISTNRLHAAVFF
jgi:hypothetical protein